MQCDKNKFRQKQNTMGATKMEGYANSSNNTPGTRGGPGGRDQRLAVKRKTPENQHFRKKIKIAKILGETNVQPRENPRSGSKAKDGKEREKKKRPKVGNNNGQLCIAMPPRVAHAKPPGPINSDLYYNKQFTASYKLTKSSLCSTKLAASTRNISSPSVQ